MMRSALIAISFLLAGASIEVARMTPIILGGGGGTPSSLVAYCTAQDPRCDDFEASTLCYSGYDSVCRFTWDSLSATGGTIDFTTAPVGSYCAGTTNSNILAFDKTNTSSTTLQVYENITAADEIWVKFYWRLDTRLSAATTQVNVATLYGGAGSGLLQLQQYLSGSTPQLVVRYATNDTPSFTYSGYQNIAEDTWYEITLHWKKSSGASDGIVFARFDSTTILNVTTNDSTLTLSRIILGSTANHTATWKSYYDNVWIDNDAEPSDCAT